VRVLFSSPAYWPAVGFGGPVWVERRLAGGLVDRGHKVDVLTTGLEAIGRAPARGSRTEIVDGATVRYLATPLRYRWMGVTPTLPAWLRRLPRPDVVHVFGFRDPLGTAVATWARARRIPYVFEPLGMFRPRLRKVALKRLVDATLFRGVAPGASVVIASSRLERDEIVACGVDPERVVARGNGFPDVDSTPTARESLRGSLGIPDDAALALYVGRIASGKGIEHLLAAAQDVPELHVVLAGPDDGHGTMNAVRRAEAGGRVHVVPPGEGQPLELYGQADVFVLPSAGESFGMAAAEAASAGTPVVVTDRCGVADAFAEGGGIVVPYEREALTAAVARVVSDGKLRRRLAGEAVEVARRHSWEHVVTLQEELYERAASRS
jgi:glycosyltransferase involved in cell wall biosynthesis